MTEKKVEYIELIYDLIFVYIIGRNNSLIEHVSPAGFVEMETYITYILATLVVLTIWYHSTLLINRYGKNDVGQHICLFVNMYLLYFIRPVEKTPASAGGEMNRPNSYLIVEHAFDF